MNRREFLAAFGGAVAAPFASIVASVGSQASTGRRVVVLWPRDRVVASFVIDDSTCLVNMGHFCMPQFAEAWPKRSEYQKPWWEWPREIPDSFVEQFLDFCEEFDVRGKYSVVPYPALVGWLDRELPGWPRSALRRSLQLVRDRVLERFDIHPEMLTHTRVVDIRTGRPLEPVSSATMENSFPQERKSVDELAAYIAYSLRILRNCELPCEGITTPGGFGNRVKSELSLAVQHAVTDVFAAEIPHYFKYIVGGDRLPEPKLEHVSRDASGQYRLTVNVPAGTGDWFGGWNGDRKPEPDRYCTVDGTGGRMVEMIERGGPAIMFCHWPGLYSHGALAGFHAFQRVIRTLAQKYGSRLHWMKMSAIARYAAARELTAIEVREDRIVLNAPFACPEFTVRLTGPPPASVVLHAGGTQRPLRRVQDRRQLEPGTWLPAADGNLVCFDLPKGKSHLELGPA